MSSTALALAPSLCLLGRGCVRVLGVEIVTVMLGKAAVLLANMYHPGDIPSGLGLSLWTEVVRIIALRTPASYKKRAGIAGEPGG